MFHVVSEISKHNIFIFFVGKDNANLTSGRQFPYLNLDDGSLFFSKNKISNTFVNLQTWKLKKVKSLTSVQHCDIYLSFSYH